MAAKRIARETPNAILANQFYNQANPDAHEARRGPEIWEQTKGKITHLVAAAGTGGTITGVGRFLKKQNPKVQVVCGDPVGSILAEHWRGGRTTNAEGVPYKVEGIGQDKLPETLDMRVIDEFQTVSDRDAFAMARRLTREEGLFGGGSSGVITDEALRENQMLEPNRVTLGQLLDVKHDRAPAGVVGVAPGATVRQALRLMSLHDVSQLPVMDGPACVGYVRAGALRVKGLEDVRVLDKSVSDVMD